MLTIVPVAIEQYVADHTAPETRLFQELADETYSSTDCPQMQVGQIEGAFLRLLVRLIGAKQILELGTFTGYSALAMAEALPVDGTLITCDNDEEAAEMAQRYWEQSPHGEKIQFRLGPALETIETLDGLFDLVFIDADKANYISYWETCLPKVRQGGLLVADNVLWSGRVLDPQEPDDRALVKFNQHVCRDDRVEAVMLTVRDGITLAWKR